MLFVRPRIIIKGAIFFGMLAFLVFFVVYGYRYDGEMKAFVPHTASYHVATWSDDVSITFDGFEQLTYEDSIDVYNIKSGCYTITKDNTPDIKCFDDYAYIWDTYVTHVDTITNTGEACTPIHISLDTTSSRCIQETCFAHEIISNFVVDNIGFIQTRKDIYVCNSYFESCQQLVSSDEAVVCYSDSGLHTYSNTILLQ